MTIRLISLILFLFSGILNAQRPTTDQQKTNPVDFSSVDMFFTVADKIKADNVTDADWAALFATPYYKFYENWGQRPYMKRTFMVALDPKQQAKRDSLIRIKNYYSSVIRHIVSVDSSAHELKSFQQQLMKRDLLAEALVKTAIYLPKGHIEKYSGRPVVAFGIFQPDGNANENTIVMDLYFATRKDYVGLIAHEAHHYFTYNLRTKFKQDEKDSSSLIVKAIGQLQLEGIADMIDKEEFFRTNGRGSSKQLFDTYSNHFKKPTTNLKKIDSLLVYISKNPGSAKQNGILIRDLLPLGGHPHGYYMAKTIQKAEGDKALVKTISNQFEFIRAFNKASKKLKGFTFSPEAMMFLSNVEKTHIIE